MPKKPRVGPHALPTVAIDPQTGQSLSGGDDSEEARLRRLRYLEAMDALRAGDDEKYDRIMEELQD